MTKQIPLTQGQVAIVDDEDFERVNQFKWHANWNKSTKSYYAYGKQRLGIGKRTTMLMHRFILGANKGEKTDHWDHDTLNNTRNNLRICTQSQNNGNLRKRTGCSSKYKGVYFCKKEHAWNARIRFDGPQIHLGYFRNEENAARAYDVAAIAKWGEFAMLNFRIPASVIEEESREEARALRGDSND